MKGIMNWFTNKLAPGMQKVFSNPWIAAVASAMQKILPFINTRSVSFYLYGDMIMTKITYCISRIFSP